MLAEVAKTGWWGSAAMFAIKEVLSKSTELLPPRSFFVAAATA